MVFLQRLAHLLAVLLCATAFAGSARLPPPEPGKLTVYFLDVGQGDAALIVSPTGKTILVDAGPPEASADVADLVRSVTSEPLDLVILSHPHLDHLGGLRRVLREIGAKRYLDPEFDHPSSTYRALLDDLADRQIPYVEAKPGEDGTPFSLGIGGDASITVFWPQQPRQPFLTGTRSDANANSIVFRLTYGATAFLFTGDAEADTEARLLRSGVPLQATLLKVAHHGSRHSSQAPFVERVSPKVAVISCGAGNEYRHPHGKALSRLQSAGARVARTDEDGTIRAVSDGKVVAVDALGKGGGDVRAVGLFEGELAGSSVASSSTEPELAVGREEPDVAPVRGTHTSPVKLPEVTPPSASAAGYVASRKSRVFHRTDCPTAERISVKNRLVFEDRASAAKDRRPSGDCNP